MNPLQRLLLLLRRLLRAILRPPRPIPPFVQLIREVNDMLVYRITPAAPGVSDVVTQEITATIDGIATVHPLSPGGSFELSLGDGASVTVTQVDIDDAGNRSEASAPLSFVANDTIPPPVPGTPTAELLREE